MMLAEAVAASPRRREVAFIFPEGLLVVSSAWDGTNRSLEEENSGFTLRIHFPNDTQ
jgi:hypothetical protein